MIRVISILLAVVLIGCQNPQTNVQPKSQTNQTNQTQDPKISKLVQYEQWMQETNDFLNDKNTPMAGKEFFERKSIVAAVEEAFCKDNKIQEMFTNVVTVCNTFGRDPGVLALCASFMAMKDANLCYSAYRSAVSIIGYLKSTTNK